MNTVISVAAALPAAYAFSRYKFLGDKHLFFWLLTNRMAPPAVFALPFFQFYSSVNLFDTHVAVALSHCLFNIPLAVWILEGFMSSVPKELDETAYVDGYSFWRFFFKIFIPTITAGIGITMFFCFMFSWVELLLAKTLTAVAAKPIAATTITCLVQLYSNSNLLCKKLYSERICVRTSMMMFNVFNATKQDLQEEYKYLKKMELKVY